VREQAARRAASLSPRGSFSADATAFASGRNVQLIDGQRLEGMLRKAERSGDAAVVAEIDSANEHASAMNAKKSVATGPPRDARTLASTNGTAARSLSMRGGRRPTWRRGDVATWR